MRSLLGPIILTLAVCASTALRAGDWPQVLGPQRDGHAAEDERLATWRGVKPTILWRFSLGSGYAGAAVADGRVYVAHREGAQERLECVDARTGRSVWRTSFRAHYRPGIDPDDGPRSVPVVAGDVVLFYGAAGDLRCLDRASGRKRWERPLRNEFNADDGYFGAGSTPVVVGDTVVAVVGGQSRPPAGVVAMNLADGRVRWTASEQEAAYASPILIPALDAGDAGTAEGEDAAETAFDVLCVLRLETVVLDAETGQIEARHGFGRRGPTVNAATPLHHEGHVFLTANYGVGAKMLRRGAAGFNAVWSGDDNLSSHYMTPVRIGDHLYGIHGREDLGVGELRCVRWSDGRVRWQRPGFGNAHLVAAGDRLVAQKLDGELQLLAAQPGGFTSLGRHRLPAGTYRALPALADGVLYCRATDQGSGQLIAVRLPRQEENADP